MFGLPPAQFQIFWNGFSSELAALESVRSFGLLPGGRFCVLDSGLERPLFIPFLVLESLLGNRGAATKLLYGFKPQLVLLLVSKGAHRMLCAGFVRPQPSGRMLPPEQVLQNL